MIHPTAYRRFAVVLFAGLLVVLITGLPLLHGLHHDLSKAPADCPVRLLEQAMLLLFVILLVLYLRLFLCLQPHSIPMLPGVLPMRLFPGFQHIGRSPPD